MKKAYRRSIWKFHEEYNIDSDFLSSEQLRSISIIQSIESAKKRTPSIPVEAMLNIVSHCEDLKEKENITAAEFQSFLNSVDCRGAGVKTIICILAVITNGLFPPLDIKIAKAARIKGYIEEHEERDVNGSSLSKICDIYINKITSNWRKELSAVESAEELDNIWGSLSEDSTN